ncbi:flavoprotein-like protein [Scheffersomyces amazonensis]|uniref:flavoprotein-like protein n=1 Tax=Scheffersomyces amazonensis TaxID=1078765 RepID=UPI00315D79DF
MKVAIVIYSTYGHIVSLSKGIKEGVEESKLASQVDLFQIPETLSKEVLELIHAPEKPKDIPVATIEVLSQYDAFLFGIPTRFGHLPAQWIDFWGQTGGLWAQGALYGKPAGIFVSTGTPGGGQETTARNAITYLAHHGLPYIPLGYAPAFADITNLEEFHGGSPYGAGTYAGSDGSRHVTELELRIAKAQGASFASSAIKLVKTSSAASPEESKSSSKTAVASTVEKSKDVAPKKAAPVAQRAQQTATETAKDSEKSGCFKCIIM